MFRPILLAIAVVALAAPARAQDLAGNWRITSSATPEGGSYGGAVTINPKGECYTVEWVLNSGERYSGIGLNARGVVLAVAYGTGPAEDYGVVLYAPKSSGDGFEGWWCQPNGSRGAEDLSAGSLAGTHRLTAAGYTGSVTIERFGTSPTNYRLNWTTSSGNYEGFGMTLDGTSDMLVGVWGNLQGTGVVLYSLVNLK
jgi:hypothetical protein